MNRDDLKENAIVNSRLFLVPVMGSLFVMLVGLNTPSIAATPDQVRHIQACLTLLGYPVAIDGIIGPDTTRASLRYYRSRFGPGYLKVPPSTQHTMFVTECAIAAHLVPGAWPAPDQFQSAIDACEEPR